MSHLGVLVLNSYTKLTAFPALVNLQQAVNDGIQSFLLYTKPKLLVQVTLKMLVVLLLSADRWCLFVCKSYSDLNKLFVLLSKRNSVCGKVTS